MIDKVLEAREKRYDTILDLIKKYKLPVICGKINYPGSNKNTPMSQKAYNILENLIISKFKDHIIEQKNTRGADGNAFILVVNLNPIKAKKMAMDMEIEHELGRIFDIDIYDLDGSSIGREKMGVQGRKCVICNSEARICIRERKHSLEDTINSIDKLINKYEIEI